MDATHVTLEHPDPKDGWQSLSRTLGSLLDQPEKRLMLAVLQDAIDTVLPDGNATGVTARRLRASTEAWFAADEWDWPFSFVCVCQALNLDASRVRRSLASRRRAWLAAHPEASVTYIGAARGRGRREILRRWRGAGGRDGFRGRFGEIARGTAGDAVAAR